MQEQRRANRHLISVQRSCTLGLIDFKHLAWSDHAAQIVDMSVSGVGIQSRERIEPGIVWFKDRVGGHRGGLLMWARPDGMYYRGGIRFVPLSPSEEQYLHDQIAWSGLHEPARDIATIVESIMESVKKGGRES